MEEIRFHGRGGQGTVIASISLAKAFFDSGYHVQTFPVFGVERRGAPVEAYLRIDNREKILSKNNVYTPDHIVVMDSKLLKSIDVTKGLKKGGWIIINAKEPPPGLSKFKDYRIALIDASNIALNHGLGTKTGPIINTAMLGAFSKVMNSPDIESIERAIIDEVPVKIDENVRAARDAFNNVVFH